RFHRWKTNRVWTRDSGCAFVLPTSGAKAPVIREDSSAGLKALHHPNTTVRARMSVSRLNPKDQSPHPVATNATRVGQPKPTPTANQLSAVKWRFNAWAKYSNWQRDEKIGSLMAQATGARELRPTFGKNRVVLEGGSIDV